MSQKGYEILSRYFST
ncbi:hypothetical protein N3930_40305 [Bacillus thuringiensis]|nr:hypothetical protein [Bacillus thuringiensis]